MARVTAERHLPDVAPAEAATLWWDTTRWASFVEGFAGVHKREGAWPAAGGRLVWDARHDSDRGRVVEVVAARYGDDAEIEVEDGRLTGTQAVAFSTHDAGTRVSLSLRWTSKVPAAPLADLVYVRRRLRGELERTLARFAREIAMERELAGGDG